MTECASLTVLDLGRVPYLRSWELQKRIQQQLIAGSSHEYLLLCEHNPVITLGRRAKDDNILTPPETLDAMGVERFEVERGGDVTWHGPGQLVVYPLVNLSHYRKDVHWYMRSLELVVLKCLKDFDIEGFQLKGKTGVWVGDLQEQTTEENLFHNCRKIASIGVRLSRWCTLHGVSLNVANDNEGFTLIHPCGFEDVVMTTIQQEVNRLNCRNNEEFKSEKCKFAQNILLNEVKRSFVRHFKDVFTFQPSDDTVMCPNV